jgi:hypothetical protein
MALHVETRAAGVLMTLIAKQPGNRREWHAIHFRVTGSVLAMTPVTRQQEEV